MADRLKTQVRKAIFRLRKSRDDLVIGIIEETRGFREFLLRRLTAAARG